MPKRLAFTCISMKERTQLAVLDFNENIGRRPAKTKEGLSRFKQDWSKRSNDWITKVIREPKTYKFRTRLVFRIRQRRLDHAIIYRDKSSHLEVASLPKTIACKPKPDRDEALRLSCFH
ncbi:hypothetical protein SKAU_G00116950 [Synaphobranchus kaupii]|uniref:Uncharacterized protein n=1 Tax=Synaphobranchus kaupii TaxID=118154 RepID=A0A9Q1FN35_SYNKA|nr:hypothetical protein SKAU_G00116950 [Synaphobranchus kaupii]